MTLGSKPYTKHFSRVKGFSKKVKSKPMQTQECDENDVKDDVTTTLLPKEEEEGVTVAYEDAGLHIQSHPTEVEPVIQPRPTVSSSQQHHIGAGIAQISTNLFQCIICQIYFPNLEGLKEHSLRCLL